MWLTSRVAPALAIPIPAPTILAVCLPVAGAALDILGVLAFRRAKTTVNPMAPGSSSSLVCTGLYALSRNPMYLGLLAILLGWAFFLSNAIAFLWLPAFVLYMNRFQIEPEERALAARFGQEAAAYRSSVRRWL